jgi:hypothetical protein
MPLLTHPLKLRERTEVTGQVKLVRHLGHVRLKRLSSVMNSLFPSLESLMNGNNSLQFEQAIVKYHSPFPRDSVGFDSGVIAQAITRRPPLRYQEKTGPDQEKAEAGNE